MPLKVEFPQGKIYVGNNKKAYLRYNKDYVNKFNTDVNKTQVYLDNKVISYLGQYVSKKTGVQELSIRASSDAGSGKVHINVPYASVQAYSPRIKKRVGLRGTRPFERMCADKKQVILQETANYSRRLER